MEFSNKIKKVRSKLNLSQIVFAKELGVSRSTLIRWENGEFNPNYKGIQKLEEYCKEKKIEFD